jgi:hypothetical protein
VQRSNREGPLADIPSARVRFAAEAGFLILVAVGAALAELRPLAIIILMACAWLLVALIERASSRETGRADEVEPVPDFAPQPAPEPLPATEAREAYRWFFWRRARARMEELPSPTASLEERPARSHVRRLEPEPEPVQEAPAAIAEPAPEPAEPGPAVTTRPLDLPGLEEPAPAEPAAAPSRSRFLQRPGRAAAPPVPPTPPPPPPAREWNIWDLERRARDQAGDASRDEEWSALFTHLRPYANADGVLPKEFDDLVRESFGQLIEAA